MIAPASVIGSTALVDLQAVYDNHRYLDVWQTVSGVWQASTQLEQLSVDELISSGRLALRLGGPRVARHLFRRARAIAPLQPEVRYFTDYVSGPGLSLLDEIAAFEAVPDLGGDRPEVRANWLAQHATLWARLRNMPRALELMRQAHAIYPGDAWLHSTEADVWGLGDDWVQSLRVAEKAWSIDPRSPWTSASLAAALMNNGQIGQAIERLANVVDETQSADLVRSACWYQCAWTELLEGDERLRSLARARSLAERIPALAPLADREFRMGLAGLWLDIAQLGEDRGEMERWASAARSPFHRQVLANLQENPHGRRIRLPYRRVLQKHAECVPTSMSSALSATGVEVSTSEFATDVTFGGTAEWAAADWLKSRGLHARFFTATPETAWRLLERGIAFMVTWPDDDGGHAVAVVGMDQAAGIVLAHDPSAFRGAEYLLRAFDQDASPYGLLGLAAVGSERAEELDALLPPEAALVEATEAHRKALALFGPSASQTVLSRIAVDHPSHPAVRYLTAIQDLEEGRTGQALKSLQVLIEQFPRAPQLRSNVTIACRALGNTSLLRQTLKRIVETGNVAGVEAQTGWIRPHPRYVVEYADMLRASTATLREAEILLRSVLRNQWWFASAWHVLADLRWDQRRIGDALLAYSIASSLAPHEEHYAAAYVDALAQEGRIDEGLAWLEDRVQRLGRSAQGVSTWITWIGVLEQRGRPRQAIEIYRRAAAQHGTTIAFMSFAVSFLARTAQWEEARTQLDRLAQTEGRAAFHEAAVAFHRMHGEPRIALEHAESWAGELQRSMAARYEVLSLLSTLEGEAVAADRAQQWMRAHPANEDFEEAFCQHAEGRFFWRKIRVLRMRLKRNAEDGWAWRELIFAGLAQYEKAGAERRRRMTPRLEAWLAEASRVSQGHVSLIRAQALWLECRDRWREAIETYLEALRLQPDNFYSYRRAWECGARLPEAERRGVWAEMEPHYLAIARPLPNAGEMIGLLARRFGVPETEAIVGRWRERRPDDPNVLEAAADLLLDHGRGRATSARALDLLEDAVERFPEHAGLRYSLARAFRALERTKDANRVFEELVQRSRNDISALMELARVQQSEGDTGLALQTLERAQTQAPLDPRPLDRRAQLLLESNRQTEALEVVDAMMRSIPNSVQTYEFAIARFGQCGLRERAVQAARAGTEAFLRGAYLWLLLGKTLQEHSELAEPGEIERCYRRSLKENATLFESADWLAVLLVEQHREAEATVLLREIEVHMTDPSAALGRLAWIRRQGDEKARAIEDIGKVVRDAPWYSWGWHRLIEWLREDERWAEAKELLQTIPASMLSDTQFRRKRLEVLEKAGAAVSVIDEEWDALLRDLPEDTPLHLGRFDVLQKAGRMPEAAEVLRRSLPAEKDNLYLRARLVDLYCFEKNYAAALEDALFVCFTRLDESDWPANHVWEKMRSAGLTGEWIGRVRTKLKEGKEPAGRALVLYAQNIIDGNNVSWKWLQQSWLNPTMWKIDGFMRLVEQSPWMETHHLAELMALLNDNNYRSSVVGCWRRMQTKGLAADTDAWAQTGNAFINLRKKRLARALLADWRTRKGIRMWMLTNYVIALPRLSKEGCREALLTCQEALEKLPHDHCARYLVYMGGEACVLDGDTEGLLALWKKYSSYFERAYEKGEYFPSWQSYLTNDLPLAVRRVSESDRVGFVRLVWKLRAKRLWNPATRRTARQLFVVLLRLALIGMASGGALLQLFK